MLRHLATALVLFGFVGIAARADDELHVRSAVERSLPFLEREGVVWIKGRGCMSCHTFTFTIWSHQEARRAGLPVDDGKLTEWIAWAKDETRRRHDTFKLTDAVLAGIPATVQDRLSALKDKSFDTEAEFVAAVDKAAAAQHREVLVERAFNKGDGGGLDNLHQLILAGASLGDDKWTEELVELLRKWQEPDGSWKPAGQLPGTAEQHDVTTRWTMLALASIDGPDAKKLLEAAGTGESESGQTIESLVVRLLMEPQDQAVRDQMLKRQNPDGGWSWRVGGPSDAFATGQALYALSACPDVDDAVRRGQRYLVDSQDENGSWSVPPKSISTSTAAPRLKKLEPIYRYWGTAWATIGLLRTLP